MDKFDGAVGAERQGTQRVGTCWECGKELLCTEYIVCCTGTVFHICPDCEAKVQGDDLSDESSEVKSES